MSIIPLDVQRRCERRWAARFAGRRNRSHLEKRPERESQQIAGPARQKQKKTHRVEVAGSRPLSAV